MSGTLHTFSGNHVATLLWNLAATLAAQEQLLYVEQDELLGSERDAGSPAAKINEAARVAHDVRKRLSKLADSIADCEVATRHHEVSVGLARVLDVETKASPAAVEGVAPAPGPREGGVMPPLQLLQALDGWLHNTGHDEAHPWRKSIGQTLASHATANVERVAPAPAAAAAPGAITIDAGRLSLLRSSGDELWNLARLLAQQVAAHRSGESEWMRGLAVRINALSSVVLDAADPEEDIGAAIAALYGPKHMWPAHVCAWNTGGSPP